MSPAQIAFEVIEEAVALARLIEQSENESAAALTTQLQSALDLMKSARAQEVAAADKRLANLQALIAAKEAEGSVK